MELQGKFYSFEQALDARFRIPMDDAEASKQILSAVYVHENDFPLALHYHDFYELNIITAGSGTHIIGQNSFTAQTGDVFVIPPQILHSYEEAPKQELKILHILLSKKFMLEYENVLKNINGYSLLFNIEPELRKNNNIKLFASIENAEFIYYLHEINKLLDYCSDISNPLNETNKNVKVLNLICDLASTLISSRSITPLESVPNLADLLHVLSYIENNFAENITLNELCKIANMSRSTLLKQFSKLCKRSPTDYLQTIRVENACKMLEHSDSSIAQIAQDCGFYDSSHFSKIFFRMKNILPKDYRVLVKS